MSHKESASPPPVIGWKADGKEPPQNNNNTAQPANPLMTLKTSPPTALYDLDCIH